MASFYISKAVIQYCTFSWVRRPTPTVILTTPIPTQSYFMIIIFSNGFWFPFSLLLTVYTIRAEVSWRDIDRRLDRFITQKTACALSYKRFSDKDSPNKQTRCICDHCHTMKFFLQHFTKLQNEHSWPLSETFHHSCGRFAFRFGWSMVYRLQYTQVS